jgi:iron complex transport system permease protein
MNALSNGRRTLVLRSRRWPLSYRLDVQSWVVIGALLAFAGLLVVLSLASGDFAVSFADVLRALLGQADGRIHMVVVEWRLPRVLLALLLGAALGMAGAIFQSLTRNPLGSPDIIGFDAGSYTGALIVITLLGGGYMAVAGGALVGGLVTALLVYLLAYRRGVQGFRLIIVGIGVSAMLNSLNTWMLLRAKVEVAMMASVWGAGSLNGMTLERLSYAGVILLVLIPAALLLNRPMAQLELGDDAARGLGVNAEKSRLLLLVVGVGLTAVVTATAGPIGFVALVAPQLARRLTGDAGVSLLPSAAMGGVLLLAADFIAQRAFAPTQLPVGIVTVSLGGVYFAWLLIREARR